MKERHFLFSDAMARAIIEGRKTQTRRPLQGQSSGTRPALSGGLWGWHTESDYIGPLHLPAAAGDVLIGREAWRTVEQPDGTDGVLYRADHAFRPIDNTPQAADAWVWAHGNGKWRSAWRPSIHMPRWAARIVRPITGARVERLQSITEADAVAEGWQRDDRRSTDADVHRDAARDWFSDTWDSIYAGRGLAWENNPWVAVVEFGRDNVKGVK